MRGGGVRVGKKEGNISLLIALSVFFLSVMLIMCS